VIDYKKYLDALKKAKFSELRCPHCAAEARSANGKKGLCTFCEQPLGAAAPDIRSGGFEPVFKRLHEGQAEGSQDDAFADLEKLLEGSPDPVALYVSALFYLSSSESDYRARDYALPGFMEANHDKIRSSMDKASKWKECLYRASQAAGEQSSAQAYVRFMSHMKLGRLADASVALDRLTEFGGQNPTIGYAEMVYDVGTRSKTAESSLSRELKTNEPDSFYYLAEHLARCGMPDRAAEVLARLGEVAEVRMSARLLGAIGDAQGTYRV
jgi:hypothetical protein